MGSSAAHHKKPKGDRFSTQKLMRMCGKLDLQAHMVVEMATGEQQERTLVNRYISRDNLPYRFNEALDRMYKELFNE